MTDSLLQFLLAMLSVTKEAADLHYLLKKVIKLVSLVVYMVLRLLFFLIGGGGRKDTLIPLVDCCMDGAEPSRCISTNWQNTPLQQNGSDL